MAIRDILVSVDDDATSPARTAIAVKLAKDHQARLTALYVSMAPRIPEYVRAQLPPSVAEVQAARMRETSERLAADLRKVAQAENLDIEWRAVEGDIVATAMLHARYCDVTIVGQASDEANVNRDVYARLGEDLVMGSGRPVLVVPRYGSFASCGERILIAWNGTREATRAVHDALPFLRRAKQAMVLSINPGASVNHRIPGADIARHLARHGVRCEATTTQADSDIEVGDVLLSRAADLGADMIVMGAYGHSRLREMALGGVTRHLIKHMTAPTLMAH